MRFIAAKVCAAFHWLESLGLACHIGLVLVALKATGQLTWSWLWVLTPFWLLAALYALLTAVAFVGMIMPTLRRTVTKPVKRIAPIGSAATAS